MTDIPNHPLRARDANWAQGLARSLGAAGISPEFVSFFGIAFAFVGACALMASSQTFGGWRVLVLVIAAAAIQLRLICNRLDGLMADARGQARPLRPLWSELPDRFSDAILMVGAGLAASPTGFLGALTLGWICAVLAILTAYLRELGRSLGLPADRAGPMTGPSRMATLTLAALLATTETWWRGRGWCLFAGLILIAALSTLTLVRRVRRLARALQDRAGGEDQAVG